MRIVESRGNDRLAQVFVAELDDGSLVEFVESIQPPVPRDLKWVLIVSVLRGCPVSCAMCDAGGEYAGPLSTEEIIGQIDFLVRRRYPNGAVPVPKFKIQFARMGEPAYNDDVLDVLLALPSRYAAPGLMPCVSTIAPVGRRAFFDRLRSIKNELYPGGRFQLQFSMHSTCEEARNRLIPAPTMTFGEIARYGALFFEPGDRKITLNFAASRGAPIEPARLADRFSPDVFTVKLTPINPTRAAARAGLAGIVDFEDRSAGELLASGFRTAGFETILSVGEEEENGIGSNCGLLAYARAARSDGARDAAR